MNESSLQPGMILPIDYSLWPGKGTPVSALLWEVSSKSLTACLVHAEVAWALPADLLVDKTRNSLQTGLVILLEARKTLPWSAFQITAPEFPRIHEFAQIRSTDSRSAPPPGFAPGLFAPPLSRESRRHSQLLQHWAQFRQRAWGKALEDATGFFADLDVSPLIALSRREPTPTRPRKAHPASVPAMRSSYSTKAPGSYFDTPESSFSSNRVMNQPAAFGDRSSPPLTESETELTALNELRQEIRRHLLSHRCTSFNDQLLEHGDVADLIQLLLSLIP